ncbi:MAG TPA: DUF2267 domain-containing protein [Streptosporangiaceae bacterium]|nr:DUF2267 domain-containing protein [Streptosporangiaceae bacterium]
MQHDEFIGHVQDRAHLFSRGDAERACRATLETLGQRVPEGLADNLAAQLPHEIGEHLRRTEVSQGQGTGERFGRRDFIARVAERAGVREQQAAFIIRAVTEGEEAFTADPDLNLPELGRRIVRLLGKRKVDLTSEDVEVMQRVVDFVAEQEANRPPAGAGDERWRRSLMTVGHDPLKP